MSKLHLQGRQLLLEPMPLQCLEERTILNHSVRSQKKGDVREPSPPTSALLATSFAFLGRIRRA
jgi:hypothetical protein